MSLTIKNSRDLISPENFKLKVLLYAMPGWGKTTWAATAPKPLFAAAEAGDGGGILSVAHLGVDYFEPTTLPDLEAFSKGLLTQKTLHETLVQDSATDMVWTFIKDAALMIPRNSGNSPKRALGIPELDDYGSMAELTRRNLRQLLSQPKHVVVTARLRESRPDPESGKGELVIGPDLPGQLMLGATAMFDFVFAGIVRQRLLDPKDAKSRIIERILITQPTGIYVAKCRATLNAVGRQSPPLLDAEEVFDLSSGRGTWPYLFNKIVKRYTEFYAAQKPQVAAERPAA